MLCSIHSLFYQDFATLLYHTASLQGNVLKAVGVAHTLNDSRCVCLFIREIKCNTTSLFCFWRNSPQWATASSFTRFLDHIQTHRSRQDYSGRVIGSSQTTHNTHNRQTSTSPVVFEPTISGGERSHTYALNRAATGTGNSTSLVTNNCDIAQTQPSFFFRNRIRIHILKKVTFFATLSCF